MQILIALLASCKSFLIEVATFLTEKVVLDGDEFCSEEKKRQSKKFLARWRREEVVKREL